MHQAAAVGNQQHLARVFVTGSCYYSQRHQNIAELLKLIIFAPGPTLVVVVVYGYVQHQMKNGIRQRLTFAGFLTDRLGCC